ncbi:hypothetical protein I6B64_13080 [Staphylococcus aureus]|jgi:hypothetical protein|uniref:Uncharacterized protein n=1 Tax=Staphylococcus argenteus TaxID=985002 RepID=A0A7U7PXC2_9STAP|nr:hypothetical protein [Staphylococcus aureus]MBE2160216.1 hypothetical protein [Staphylococcus argenteus]MBH4547330.1 hypothetical protein [Staphylococcus aureus]MBH4557612.1 hypothetical protein [Staphylococcus aureus]MBH4565533.1 hypothetical protein [Staphylococcus aureus]MBH4571821.1 hypothetical protein [Staphylococcus aureus]
MLEVDSLIALSKAGNMNPKIIVKVIRAKPINIKEIESLVIPNNKVIGNNKRVWQITKHKNS